MHRASRFRLRVCPQRETVRRCRFHLRRARVRRRVAGSSGECRHSRALLRRRPGIGGVRPIHCESGRVLLALAGRFLRGWRGPTNECSQSRTSVEPCSCGAPNGRKQPRGCRLAIHADLVFAQSRCADGRDRSGCSHSDRHCISRCSRRRDRVLSNGGRRCCIGMRCCCAGLALLRAPGRMRMAMRGRRCFPSSLRLRWAARMRVSGRQKESFGRARRLCLRRLARRLRWFIAAGGVRTPGAGLRTRLRLQQRLQLQSKRRRLAGVARVSLWRGACRKQPIRAGRIARDRRRVRGCHSGRQGRTLDHDRHVHLRAWCYRHGRDSMQMPCQSFPGTA